LNLTRRLFAAGAALLLFSPAAAAPKKQAPDWTRTVVATADGGFRMGNPDARVKLVEYGSLTCPHCRHFAVAAMVPLKAYVRSGKVSFEYRNYVLNGIDVAATLVARCGGPARFFPVVDKLYATQADWVAKISGLPEAEKDKIRALSDGQRLVRLAEVGGIQKLAEAHGLPAAQANKCLADPAGMDRLGSIHEAAQALGVQGTPTFFVNGAKVDAGDWPSLEPHLKRAGG
jgi:protein-disulfide isomerase